MKKHEGDGYCVQIREGWEPDGDWFWIPSMFNPSRSVSIETARDGWGEWTYFRKKGVARCVKVRLERVS